MATKHKDGKRWSLDDAWWVDPPTIPEWDEEDTETLWAADTQAWEGEPQTSPDVSEALPPQPPPAGSRSIP